MKHSIHLEVSHLPRAWNVLVNHFSWSFSSHHKWCLHPEFISVIFQKSGSSQVDLFATRQNRKCHQFCFLCSLPLRHLPALVGRLSTICLSPNPLGSQGSSENQMGQAKNLPNSPRVAMLALIWHASGPLGGNATLTPTPPRLDFTRP